MNPNRRSKKLVQPKIQIAVIGSFLAAATVCLLTQAVAVNLMIRGAAKDLPNDAHLFFAEWPSLLILSLLGTLAVLVPLMVAIGLRVTHRLVGPLARIENALRDYADGRPAGSVRVRKDDYLFELACQLERVLEKQAQTQAAPLRLVKDGDASAQDGDDSRQAV